MKRLSSACALALVAAACSPADPDPGVGPGQSGSGGSSGASGSAGSAGSSGSAGTGGSSGSAGAGGSGGEQPNPSVTCGVSTTTAPMLRRLTRRELEGALTVAFPEAAGQWQSVLSSDTVTHWGFDNDAATLLVSNQKAREIADTAESVAAVVSGTALVQLLPCAQSSPDASCATEFVGRYGKRLFRRPLSEAEVTRYLAFFTEAAAISGFAGGVGWVTRALIQSPHTVYRHEIGSASGGGYQLGPYEIATELAFSFTGTAPSDALLAQADAWQASGTRPTADELRALAATLVSSSGGAYFERFFDSWIGYGRAAVTTKTNVPNFDTLKEQLVGETRLFLGEAVITRGGGLRELLTATYTKPTQALAAYYSADAAATPFPQPASDYALVEKPAGQGIGLLGQGSVLATLAQPNGSSPTKRGVLVYERFLCREKPAVPNDVPELPGPDPGVVTTRQRYEMIHVQGGGSCAGCHAGFDPIGFGFEHFDEGGRYRTSENGLPVDAASFVPDEQGDPLFSFTTQEELVRGLAEVPEVGACVSGQLATWVFGGSWACLGEARRGDFISGAAGFMDYFISLAGEPQFVERRQPGP